MKQKEVTPPAGEETQMPDADQGQKPEPGFLEQYRKCYPDVAHFHVTGDNLVFLEKEYDQAVSHQQSIGKGELTTY